MLIDTHCHLHDQEWFTPEQAKNALQDATSRDIKQIICIGTNPDDSLNARDFALAHQNVYWTFGIHPEFADKYQDSESQGEGLEDWEDFATMCSNDGTSTLREDDGGLAVDFETMCSNDGTRANKPCNDRRLERVVEKSTANPNSCPIAIGEVGLDYHYDSPSRLAQIRLFEQMLQLATDLHLPVSLHIREAFADLWPILDNFPKITGVIHSFTGSKRDLAKALERDFYIGVNGLITYTTTPLPPLEKMLLETDAPFLTPFHNRDTMNVPGNVQVIVAFLSGKMGVAETIIAEQTTHNATQLFGIKFTGDGFFAPSDPA